MNSRDSAIRKHENRSVAGNAAQGKYGGGGGMEFVDNRDPSPVFTLTQDTIAQKKGGRSVNNTALSNNLKAVIEHRSGVSMDDVRLFYNSAQPAQFNALAYERGPEINVASGQEHHLPHEAWHVVQQAQDRVKSTIQMHEAIPVNDDPNLEHKADVMEGKALQMIRTEESDIHSPADFMNAQPVTQLRGGKASKFCGNDKFTLKPDETIEYTQEGKGFLAKITITHHNGRGLSKPVVIKGPAAANMLQSLDECDGFEVIGDEPSNISSKGRGEQMLVEAREKNVVTGGNPDQEGGTVNSYFSQPIASDISKDGAVTVQMGLHTLNRWDRVSWKARVGPKGAGLVPVDKSWWSNPAWIASDMKRYTFKSEFTKLPGDGVGQGGVRRPIEATIPDTAVKKVYGEDLSAFNEASIICFGMEVYYAAGGPTTANKSEYEQAYGTSSTAHQYGLGATSSLESYGYVNLAGHELPEGDWLSEEDVWKQDIPDNPSPNIRLSFPEGYENEELIETLKPESGINIATRIENEATLKVSSLENLKEIVSYLDHLSKNKSVVANIMKGDKILDQFNWSVSATEDNSMVFTDVYLDDPGMTALRAGVGIRKRSSKTATKLNVKTGAGYQVGKLGKGNREKSEKSDIYRRHEIGYDLKPGAKISDIGAFLGAGMDKYDPWNRGGEQANLAVPDEKIDFSKLQGTMVLQGDRKKFNLKAVSKESGRAINIEISCDHTVGRRFSDYQQAKQPEDLFKDTKGTYKQVFNIEMELEHLGAGAPMEQKSATPMPQENKQKNPAPPSGSMSEPKRPPPGHPGRLYMLADTANPKFNTPSFEVFAKAHNQMISAMQVHLKDRGELKEDKQKLENLFSALFDTGTK